MKPSLTQDMAYPIGSDSTLQRMDYRQTGSAEARPNE